ncbi:Myocilin [Gossypium arboreum]|uniref:Uncharacterized protein n=2 Tax=Gossypium arboreum TaxID=29729 RepID=A0ABR0N736_GOSAR|nr:hypothetical protein PVK06_040239 [Gossypium arboreum]KHG12816.1 Myocilin [Gossypium arboreum]
MSMMEFPYSPNDATNHLKICVPEVAKERMSSVGLSSGVKKPFLQELALSLQVLLAKASMVGLGLKEGISEVEVNKRELDDSYQNVMRALKRACELHSKLNEENQDM